MIREANIDLCPEYYAFSYVVEDKKLSGHCKSENDYEICVDYSTISDGVIQGCIIRIILTGVSELVCYQFLYIVK